ncbi:MAG: cytidylate kinase [Crocinitomicaceae bacterium]|nr:cytidylate kinase [Crocinitomicaceae bacterium]
MTNKITIAVDGHSSCGKSTLAKDLARKLNYSYIDSGAMYRAVTLYALRKEISGVNAHHIKQHLDNINIHFETNEQGLSAVYLNNENVESEIRMKHVAESVSRIAEIKEVREKLVMEQRKLGKSGGIVMDGRDIGSVVFPNAELKFFITADIDVRTERRFSEMKEKGLSISKKEVESNLTQRDKIDSSRKESPLIKVKEAIEINNSNLSKEEQLELALKIVQETIDKLS